MQKLFWLTCLAACVCFAASTSQAQTLVQKGTVKGGIAGAIIGGIIGNQSDDTGEGVAIGAAVGALAGNVVGKSQQQDVFREQQFQAQLQQQEQQRLALAQQSLNRAVSIDDAINLTRSGVSQELIINQVLASGVQQHIGVSEVILLHQNGVSEQVIQAMQSAPIGEGSVQLSSNVKQPYASEQVITPVITPVVVQPAPRVIVQPAPRVIVQAKSVPYHRPSPKSSYRGRPPTRYPSYGGKYRGPSSYGGGGIRIGF